MKQEAQVLQQPSIDVLDTDLIFKLTEKDLLLDLKVLIKEYYCGTFTEDESGLKLSFTNGQNFFVSLKEITKEK